MNPTTETINLRKNIPEEYAGQRLDLALARLFPEYSRTRLKQWLETDQITVDGKPMRPRDKVKGGEEICIIAQIEPEQDWSAEPIALEIIFEDDDILIVNKPLGLVVHPAKGNRRGTLVNALLHHNPNLANVPRAGVVHRLDKDTSGLLVIAKNLAAHHHLVKQLAARTIKREYRAIVNGIITAGSTINAPIGRHPVQRTKMAVVTAGKPAITHYRVIQRFRAHTFIQVFLETGRTHQIRVHMTHIHHPIVGDMTYNTRLALPAGINDELRKRLRTFKRQALHAYALELQHPTTHATMQWTAPIPKDIENLLELLKNDVSS